MPQNRIGEMVEPVGGSGSSRVLFDEARKYVPTAPPAKTTPVATQKSGLEKMLPESPFSPTITPELGAGLTSTSEVFGEFGLPTSNTTLSFASRA